MKTLPRPKKKHPLFGSVYFFAVDPFTYLPQFCREYGDLYELTALWNKVAVLNDPGLIKEVLLDRRLEFEKSFGYQILAYLLGEGLLTSDGEKWKQQRKLMQPAFHRERLKNLVDVMAAEAMKLSAEWKNKRTTNFSIDMNRLTLEIISKTMFSEDVEDMAQQISHSVTILNDGASKRITNPLRLPRWIPTPENKRMKKHLSIMDEILYGIIDNRKGKTSRQSVDLLDMLISASDDEGKSMDRKQVRDEAMTIFIAGHETTAVSMSYIFYLLARNPEEKERLREEVRSVCPDGPIGFEDLSRLIYTKQVVEEAMRLYPPAWILGRRSVRELELGGYRIPAQTNLLIPIFHLHRDERYWEQPDDFRPERFAPELRNEINRYQYMPFGAGPRTCIGNHFAMMEMQVILATLVRDFDFELPAGIELQPQAQITLRPEPQITLKIQSLS